MHKQGKDSPYLHQIEHKPRGDTLSHYIDEEVRQGHAPDVWVLQNILYKQLQQRLLLLYASCVLLLQGTLTAKQKSVLYQTASLDLDLAKRVLIICMYCTLLGLTISTGGYPIFSGESFTATSRSRPTTTPTMPGAHIPAKHSHE